MFDQFFRRNIDLKYRSATVLFVYIYKQTISTIKLNSIITGTDAKVVSQIKTDTFKPKTYAWSEIFHGQQNYSVFDEGSK